MNYFLNENGANIASQIDIDAYEYLAILTAAAVHDYEHPGVNNIFLVKM
jgi:hypothetical protein